ncbi:MAG: GNAT family N-acetyltransferase [Flavobacteriaceae bacterium]|nr:GNAT family N-acetyltransferase [Candidatus Onthonaster equi]
MDFKFRNATINDIDIIWKLLEQGIQKRKKEGSNQWQDGYPNKDVVRNDIENNYGFIIENDKNTILGYIAAIEEIEPAYEIIEGNWLTNDKYIVLHRLVVDTINPIKGLATWIMHNIEQLILDREIYSIKVDTNFDNIGMLRIFDKLNYHYCGKVFFRGSPRLAFQKILSKKNEH